MSIISICDYDYDGMTELFLQINSARDLLPRELFCIELESMTIEWSLPVAPLIMMNNFYMCGDSTDPRILFTTYNPKQNVTAGQFTDLYAYVTVVDTKGAIQYNKIISSVYGGIGAVPVDGSNLFAVAHSVPFVDTSSSLLNEEPANAISIIDLEGNIKFTTECDEKLIQMWTDTTNEGSYRLYTLTTTGELSIYDSTLSLLQRSEQSVLRGMIKHLKVYPDQPDTWVMSTVYDGYAIYDHSFKQLAFFEAEGAVVSPVEYTSDGTLSTFIVGGSGGYTKFSIERKNFTDYLIFAFWRYKWVLLSGMVLLLIGLIVANHFRRRSRKMLLRQEAQLHAFFTSSPDLVFILNSEGVFLEFVAGLEKDLLVPPSSFINKSIADVLPAEVVKDVRSCLKRAISTQAMATCEYSLLFDKRDMYYELRIVSMSADRVMAVVRDQTERVRAEKKLAESEGRLRALFDGARDAILLTEQKTGIVVEINQAAIELFDQPREKILGNKLVSLCSSSIGCMNHDDGARQDKTVVPEFVSCEIERTDGSRIPVEMTSEIVEIDNQMMVISFVRDISQQVKADYQRMQSEGLQKEQYKNFPVATYTWRLQDGDFILVDFNDKADMIALGKMKEYLNSKASEIYNDRPDIIADMHESIQHGKTIRKNVVYKYRISEEQRHLLATYVKVTEDLVTIYTEDVTEQRLAELALKENEEKLRAQYKGIPVPTYTWQKQGDDFVLIDFNDAAVEITKGGIKDFVGKKLHEMYPPDADVPRDVQQCHNTQEMIQCEMNFRFQTTGLERLLTVRYVPVPPDLVMVHTEDITERKEAEIALQRSEERFRALAESSLQGIFLLQEGRITYANDRFAQIVGRDLDELIGMPAKDFIDLAHPDKRPVLYENYAKRLKSENAPGHYELKIDRPDGTYRWVELSTDRIEFGDAEAIQGVAIDITDRLLAEEKVHQAELDRYNQIREIAGGVSHEIYNALYPATVALEKLTYNRDLSKSNNADRRLKLLRMTTTAVRRAIEMTEQVTQYSRLETSQDQIAVKLRPLIDEILLGLAKRVSEMNVECSVNVAEGAEIICVRSHAFSMLNNLIVNALDAMEEMEQRKLSITVASFDEEIEIKVCDTGCGVEPEAVRRLFDPFYSTKPKTGTGLGLAVVRRIVSLYDGSVDVESQLDRGTTFNILLPKRK